MAEFIAVSQLATLTRKDYKEVAKKLANWKKSDGIIIFDDYKVEGKTKMPVGLPYKKAAELEKAYKEVKEKKMHKLAKVASCLLTLGADNVSATLELKKGGLKAEKIKEAALDIFAAAGIINITVTGESADAKEAQADVEVENTNAADAPVVAPTNDKLKADAALLVKEISAKSKAYNGVLERVKAKESTTEDYNLASELANKIEDLSGIMTQLGDAADKKLQADYQKIDAVFSQTLPKVLAKLNSLKTAARQEKSDFKNKLSSARAKVQSIKVEIEKMDKTLDKLPSSFLPSGKSILSAVGL